MATTIDFSALTLNTEEARSASEAVFEKNFNRPELLSIHNVVTGVEMDKFIPIFGKLGLVGKIDPGSCNVNSVASQIPTSQKTWTPKLISGRLLNCEADLPNLLKFWKKSRIAANTWEDMDNEARAFIEDQTNEAVQNSIIRIAEFGATAHSAVGAGVGDELLTAGTDKTYFNMLNGMWYQLETDAALPTPLGYRYEITANAAVNKQLQAALAADEALQVFRSLYNNIAPEAFDGNLVFQVTKSLMDNWKDYLEDKSLNFTLDKTEKGATQWSYRGIPIVERKDWDRIIRTYFDNGTTWYLPHRCILADVANIPIGTSDEESLSTLKSEYSSYHKQHYTDFAYKVDCKVLLEQETAYAF